jgi:hypothetical protein
MQKFLTVKDTESITVILLILQIWLILRHIMFLQKSNKIIDINGRQYRVNSEISAKNGWQNFTNFVSISVDNYKKTR